MKQQKCFSVESASNGAALIMIFGNWIIESHSIDLIHNNDDQRKAPHYCSGKCLDDMI